MKLSEAIRLGSMLKPQGFGILDVEGTTCVLAAAIDAAKPPVVKRQSGGGEVDLRSGRAIPPGIYSFVELPPEWIPVMTQAVMCPECLVFDKGGTTFAHLNDCHRWPRERIADYVEALENSPLVLQRVRTETELRKITANSSNSFGDQFDRERAFEMSAEAFDELLKMFGPEKARI
jgi:hypothetical protein